MQVRAAVQARAGRSWRAPTAPFGAVAAPRRRARPLEQLVAVDVLLPRGQPDGDAQRPARAVGFDLDRAQTLEHAPGDDLAARAVGAGQHQQQLARRSGARRGRSRAPGRRARRRRRRASARRARRRARAPAPRGCRSSPAGSSAASPWRPARLISSASRSSQRVRRAGRRDLAGRRPLGSWISVAGSHAFGRTSVRGRPRRSPLGTPLATDYVPYRQPEARAATSAGRVPPVAIRRRPLLDLRPCCLSCVSRTCC